ncbi:Ycf51 family protein [Roseofilum sp. BLCC_M154]|uniref:Ycf51 family protein n=1 Tax=Roseofilum acuticapitatum BLCC-M154 TaxID=3022444 RepID=A0ABT7AQI3_9CYAN|nr:Ycf51 family protein [Roseofilum acuticapitatum]MDJ1169149.1 Ycf51 family protein [Roseofilum acuticapitatum BLCC-M154]
MPTTADFLQASEWFAIATGVSIAFTLLCFVFKWGFRFRFVGISSFMAVLTAGLFSLSLVPFTRTVVPGSVRYSLVFDNGAAHTVIAVSPQITESELEATLKQAAINLFSYGRPATNSDRPTVLARTIVHPQPQISEAIYLGKAQQSLDRGGDREITVEINRENLQQLQTLNPS